MNYRKVCDYGSPPSRGRQRQGYATRASPSSDAAVLTHRRVEHDLAGDFARFHQPMGRRGLPERHDALDLRLDLALRGGRETFLQIGRIVARPTDDGDLVVVEVREIDRHV